MTNRAMLLKSVLFIILLITSFISLADQNDNSNQQLGARQNLVNAILNPNINTYDICLVLLCQTHASDPNFKSYVDKVGGVNAFVNTCAFSEPFKQLRRQNGDPCINSQVSSQQSNASQISSNNQPEPVDGYKSQTNNQFDSQLIAKTDQSIQEAIGDKSGICDKLLDMKKEPKFGTIASTDGKTVFPAVLVHYSFTCIINGTGDRKPFDDWYAIAGYDSEANTFRCVRAGGAPLINETAQDCGFKKR